MSHVLPLEPRRLFASFAPDVTFGEEGVIGAVSTAYLLALQGDKILTAGPFRGAGVRVARNLSDGRPDASFGINGVTDITAFGTLTSSAFGAAAVGPDGVYVSSAASKGNEVAFARLNVDGGLNTRFGTRGVTSLGVPIVNAGRPFYLATPTRLAVDAQGRAVFGVSVNEKKGRSPGVYDVYGYVGRLTPTGKLDKTFGHRGYVHIGGAGISSLTLDPTGRILVQARSNAGGLTLPPQRLTADGVFDGTFNRKIREAYKSGVIGVPSDRLSYLFMEVDPAGRVLLRGNTNYGFNDGRGGSKPPIVVRFSRGGLFDKGFGESGFLELPRGAQLTSLSAYSADGSFLLKPYNSNQRFAPVFRFDADGQFLSAATVDSERGGSGLAAVEADGDLLLANNSGSVERVTLAARPPVVLAPSGMLNLYGTDAADTFTVDDTGGIVVVRTGSRTFSFDRDAVQSLQARLGFGRDRLTVTTDLDTRLFRKDGGDTITTGDGDDTLRIGEDNDYSADYASTLPDVIRLGDGYDTYFGFDGDDDIAFGDNDGLASDYLGDPISTVVNSGGGNDIIVGGVGRTYVGMQRSGGNKNVTLAGGGGQIYLGDGNDVVRVGDGGYTIDARYGRNRIAGGAGNDTIYAMGRDTIDGGAGDDTIGGIPHGYDYIQTLPRQIRGGTGDDRIDLQGASGASTVYGDAGRDTVYGSVASDWLLGGDGRDWLYGDAGNDTIDGGAADDRLFGDYPPDNDYPLGGDDLLIGGTGADFLTGGPGADRAVLDDSDTRLDAIAGVAG